MSAEKKTAVPALNVTLFGRLRISDAHQPIAGLQHRRAQELFSYLLLHRNRPYPREALATLLWEDADSTQARKYLRQALWQIQTALQRALGPDAKQLLTLDAEWVQLNSAANLSLDIARFEHAIDASQGTKGSDLSDAQREKLEHAVDLYCGDLLEGWYQDWCLFERERLQNGYLGALDKLLAWSDAHGCVDSGLAHAERILRCDPTEEEAYCHMMHLHWVAGHRSKAMRQYQRCKRVLLQELGIQPSGRTRRLYEQILKDQSIPLAGDEVDPGRVPPSPKRDNAAELVDYLTQLRTHLAGLEEQIRRDLHALTTAVKTRL